MFILNLKFFLFKILINSIFLNHKNDKIAKES